MLPSPIPQVVLATRSQTVRVLIADSTQLTGRLIAGALRRNRRLTVADTTTTSAVLDEAAAFQPDIVILSESLEGTAGKGFEVLKGLKTIVPNARTVMILDTAERHLVVEAFRRGARGLFCRNEPLKMLTKCVQRVHEGRLWVSDNQLELLLEALIGAPITRLVNSQGGKLLTKREEQVVRWLVEGLTNAGIARELKISENTVKNYLYRIFNKLGVSSRVEVLLYASTQRTQRDTRVR
jgi:two-component system nitrate/nitrite response regulator NarL